jgi:hypothetical protein
MDQLYPRHWVPFPSPLTTRLYTVKVEDAFEVILWSTASGLVGRPPWRKDGLVQLLLGLLALSHSGPSPAKSWPYVTVRFETGSPLRRLFRLEGLRWKYFNPPPRGMHTVRVKSNLTYDRRSVGQSILVSGHHLRPATDLSFSSMEFVLRNLRGVFLNMGLPLWREVTRLKWEFSYDQRSVGLSVLVSDRHLGPATIFLSFAGKLSSDICGFLSSMERPL